MSNSTLTASEVSEVSDAIVDDETNVWRMNAALAAFPLQGSFAMLHMGLTDSKHNISTAYRNLCCGMIGMLVVFFYGWALARGSGNRWAGKADFLLRGTTAYPNIMLAMAYCIVTSSLISASSIGRMRFGVMLVLAAVTCGIYYPLVTRWVWLQFGFDEGWLVASSPFHFVDFAGGSAIFVVSATVALVSSIILGPRLSVFRADGSYCGMYSNPTYVLIAAVTLITGWISLLCGTVASLEDPGATFASKAALTASLGGAASSLVGVIISSIRNRGKKVDIVDVCLAGIAGATSVSSPGGIIEVWHSLPIGCWGGLAYFGCKALLIRFKVDDVGGVIATHGAPAAIGVLTTGLFEPNDGLFYGGTSFLLRVQLLGLGAVFGMVAGSTALLLLLIKRFTTLRVPLEEEIVGLDISELDLYGMNADASCDHANICDAAKNIKQTASSHIHRVFYGCGLLEEMFKHQESAIIPQVAEWGPALLSNDLAIIKSTDESGKTTMEFAAVKDEHGEINPSVVSLLHYLEFPDKEITSAIPVLTVTRPSLPGAIGSNTTSRPRLSRELCYLPDMPE